ncbi:hypothetical protein ACWEDZ_41220, partial [Streptomyces sp. NPDC005047]
MLLGSVLNPINSTIIAVALVPIGSALGAPASQSAECGLPSGTGAAAAVGLSAPKRPGPAPNTT